MPLISRLDDPTVYTSIRAWRMAYVARAEIVRRLATDHGVTISVSGLDQWLRARASGKRRKLRHQLPPLLESASHSVSPVPLAQDPQLKTKYNLDL